MALVAPCVPPVASGGMNYPPSRSIETGNVSGGSPTGTGFYYLPSVPTLRGNLELSHAHTERLQRDAQQRLQWQQQQQQQQQAAVRRNSIKGLEDELMEVPSHALAQSFLSPEEALSRDRNAVSLPYLHHRTADARRGRRVETLQPMSPSWSRTAPITWQSEHRHRGEYRANLRASKRTMEKKKLEPRLSLSPSSHRTLLEINKSSSHHATRNTERQSSRQGSKVIAGGAVEGSRRGEGSNRQRQQQQRRQEREEREEEEEDEREEGSTTLPCGVKGCFRYAKIQGLCLAHHLQLTSAFSSPRSLQGQTAVYPAPVAAAPDFGIIEGRLYQGGRGEEEELTGGRRRRRGRAASAPSAVSILAMEEHSGGGQKKVCRVPGCKSLVKTKGLCKRHGGGIRCRHENCPKSAKRGGFCIRHGGGICQVEGCKSGERKNRMCAYHNSRQQQSGGRDQGGGGGGGASASTAAPPTSATVASESTTTQISSSLPRASSLPSSSSSRALQERKESESSL